jgi:CsoR family transcriptional regulator, copper-sensing transcriptional repressor
MAYRPKDTQERILHRLKIARGHLNKVIKMIEDDVYCIDVLCQMQAVEKAISQTEGIVLENHLKTCATEAIRAGKQEEAIKEIMTVFKKNKS